MKRLFVFAVTSALTMIMAGCAFLQSAPEPKTTPQAPVTPQSQSAAATVNANPPPLDLLPINGPLTLFTTPDPAGHPGFLAAIKEAKTSIKIEMYHLTDPEVIDALIDAKKRGLAVTVILDGLSLSQPKFKKTFDALKDGGVTAIASQPSYYRALHSKFMVTDDAAAIISTMDLTKRAATTRDFAVVLRDPKIIADLISLFDIDVKNSSQSETQEPKSLDHRLVVSPVNSRGRLSKLIVVAQKTLSITTENLGDPVIQDALKEAVSHGVKTRIIVPMCSRNTKPLYNYSYLAWLADHNIEVRVMPPPATTKTPYMHAKVLLADNATAYLGSIDFRTTSMTSARELGILFSEQSVIIPLASVFEDDWNAAIAPPSPPPTDCPVSDD